MAIDNNLFSIPFASKAGGPFINSITATNETSNVNKATYEVGFPPVTMEDIADGGLPPMGQDFNGIFNAITVALQYIQSGSYQTYDKDFSESIGGYPRGSVLMGSDGVLYQTTSDNNKNDPTTKKGWVNFLGFLPIGGGTLTGDLMIKSTRAKFSILNSSGKGLTIVAEESGYVGIAYNDGSKTQTKMSYDPVKNTLNMINLTDAKFNDRSILTTGSYGVGGHDLYTLNNITDTVNSTTQRAGFISSTPDKLPSSLSSFSGYGFTGLMFPYRTTTNPIVTRLLLTPDQYGGASAKKPAMFLQQTDTTGKFGDAIEVITTQNVNNFAAGFGYNQTYHDHSSTSSSPKSWNVAYSNTTGAPMLVIIAMGADDGNATLNIIVDGVNVAYTNARTNWNNVVCLTFMVNPGSTYTASCSDSKRTVVRWTEYSQK